MRFSPNAQQVEVAQGASRFARTYLAPSAEALDRTGGFPARNLAAAAHAGLLGINVPTEFGGRAAGAVAYALGVTELARGCASTTVAICVSNMVAEILMAFGTADQRTEHVPRLCDGRYKVGAFALSESGAGSDPGGMQTRARRTDRGWVIDGSKLWITSGTDAGLFVVWARTSEGKGAAGISAFVLRRDTPGLSVGRPERKLGLHGSTTTPLQFDGCEVGEEALLGAEGRGFRVAMMALDGGRVGIGSQALGVFAEALEAVRHDVANRSQRAGGTATADQAELWSLADMATERDAAAMLVLRAAALKDQGRPFSREAARAKLYTSERAFEACNRALTILGASALSTGATIERGFRDVRVAMIYEGTSEIQRLVIARDVMTRFSKAG